MPKWTVELRGRITRDIRWIEVEAPTLEEAKSKAGWQHGGTHEITAVSKRNIDDPRKLND